MTADECSPVVGVDAATLDLLSVLRRSGKPYEMTTREIGARTLVTAGAISQRVARAERQGLVTRKAVGDGSRAVLVRLTATGHDLVERTVDEVLHREAQLVEQPEPRAAIGAGTVARRPARGRVAPRRAYRLTASTASS